MKLIRTTILLALGAFLLPAPPPDDPVMGGVRAQSADSASLALAAMQAASDARGFCLRQPMVCSVAGDSFRLLQAKVKYSFRLLYEWSTAAQKAAPAAARPVVVPPGPGGGAVSVRPGVPADGLITGSVTRVANRDSQDDGAGSENTLRIEDLTVPWNGPRG